MGAGGVDRIALHPRWAGVGVGLGVLVETEARRRRCSGHSLRTGPQTNLLRDFRERQV